jgi:Glutathione S-transferase, C-terminal domain
MSTILRGRVLCELRIERNRLRRVKTLPASPGHLVDAAPATVRRQPSLRPHLVLDGHGRRHDRHAAGPKRLSQLDNVLRDRGWLAASCFTVADILMADILRIPDARDLAASPSSTRMSIVRLATWAKLPIEALLRDFAMFDVAIDSKLRGCNGVGLKVDDLARQPSTDRATVRQRNPRRSRELGDSLVRHARDNPWPPQDRGRADDCDCTG